MQEKGKKKVIDKIRMEIRENAGYKESAAGYKETGSSLSVCKKMWRL